MHLPGAIPPISQASFTFLGEQAKEDMKNGAGTKRKEVSNGMHCLCSRGCPAPNWAKTGKNTKIMSAVVSLQVKGTDDDAVPSKKVRAHDTAHDCA